MIIKILQIGKWEGIMTLKMSKQDWMELWGDRFDLIRNEIAEAKVTTTTDNIDIVYTLKAHIREG